MKTTNRLLAVLLSLVLLCTGLPFAFAEDATIVDSGTCGEKWNSQTESYDYLTWTLDSAGTLTISGNGQMYNNSYIWDSDAQFYRTSAPWGKYYQTIQAAVLEDGVTSIGSYAFRDCIALTSLTIPDSVTSIGYYAFYGCTSLTSVTIPDSVTSIGDYAFESSDAPQPLLLCNKDSYAASWAESNSYPYALLDGTDEDNIISETVNAKLSYSIDKRTRTLTVYNQGKLISFSSYNAPWRQYQQYVETAILSDGCTSVSEKAFYECYNLKRVVLPETMETIDASAFYCCVSLQEITIPDAVTSIGDSAFSSCFSLQTATIGDGVTSIGYSAFLNCSSLQTATIGDSVTSIGDSAFSNCFSLQTATIGNGVTSIGNYAFQNCSSLQNIVLPEGLQSIGYVAFENCRSLQSIVIPDSVTALESYYSSYAHNFANCTSLKSVVIGDGVTEIPRNAFSGCTALESVSIGDSVTSIGYEAFSNCSKLSTVLFGEKVRSIGENAFGGCSSLPAVDLPASVSSIGARAFSDSALKDITIRNKECYIEKDAISIYATIHGYAGSTAETFADDYGYYFNEITDAPPHDHDRILVKGCDPTCTAAGLTDGWQCSVCGIWFEKQKPIKALGHDYIPVETQEPTETEPGFVRYECTRCDSAYTETLPVTTHTHSFTETERKDATCLEDGFVTYTCATCGYSYTDLLVSSGHSFGAWRTFLPVEAGETGVEIRFCAVCAAYELRESDAVSPGGTGTPTDPTHTHNFVLVDTKDPTCELAGYNRYMCTCGQSKADIFDPFGHDWKAYTTYAPSCDKAGYTVYRCDRCGASMMDNVTEALGHDYQVEQVAPTCTKSGHIVTRCTRCGNKLNDWQDLPALGHIDVDGDGICDRCKVKISNSNLTPEQQTCTHKWNVQDPTARYLKVGANCQHGNIYYYRCGVCSASAKDVEGATDKTFETGSKNPDVHPADKLESFGGDEKPACEAAGTAPGVRCTACNAVVSAPKVYTTVQPHKAVPGKEATCTQMGTCLYCGRQVIAKDPNNHPKDQIRIMDEAVEPTCGAAGKTARIYCRACDKTQAATTVPATGKHIGGTATCMARAKCTVCGQEYGTINENKHDLEKHAAKTADCKTGGNADYYACKDCNRWFEDAAGTKAITDHSKVTTAVDPTKHVNLKRFAAKVATCTEKGNIEYWFCDGCSKYYKDAAVTQPITKSDTEIKTADHTWGNYVYPAGYSCTVGGIVNRECTVCKLKETKKVNANEHIELVTEKRVEPTCTKAGETEKIYCKKCGTVLTPSIELAALGHDFTNAKATGIGDNTHTFECVRCKKDSDPVPCEDKNNDGVCDTCGTKLREPEPEEKEPQGFFAKIAAFFKNLFARLFGRKK